MKKGFTLVEIMIVVAIIGLLAAIAIPSFMRARTTSQANACINNLRQIESGKEQFGMENGTVQGTYIALGQIVGPNNFVKQWPVCPNETNTTATTIARASNSYDLGSAFAAVSNGMLLGTNATCYPIGNTRTPNHALPVQ